MNRPIYLVFTYSCTKDIGNNIHTTSTNKTISVNFVSDILYLILQGKVLQIRSTISKPEF